MTKDFCQAIVENDRTAINEIVDAMIAQKCLKPSDKASLVQITEWIQSHDCVSSAELSDDLLDSEPPVQEIIITLKLSAEEENLIRTVGISLSPDRLFCH